MKHIFKIVTFCLIVSFSGMANAQPVIAPQPCDTGYWDSLNARAWLETEREIMQNQNLIFKGDSVLEYTCFDRFVGHNRSNAAPIFSTEAFLGPALESVVGPSAKNYLTANFGGTYLGGRSLELGAEMDWAVPFAEGVPGTTYACDQMAGVWKLAKCANFLHHADFDLTDGFFPHRDMAGFQGTDAVGGYDATIPEARKWGVVCGGVTGTYANWATPIDIAANINAIDQSYPFAIPTGQVFFDVADRLTPGHCQFSVETGVEIIIAPANDGGDDGVCTAPGCTWNGGGCS